MLVAVFAMHSEENDAHRVERLQSSAMECATPLKGAANVVYACTATPSITRPGDLRGHSFTCPARAMHDRLGMISALCRVGRKEASRIL